MGLEIHLFGGLSIRRDGEVLDLPHSRKTRALLAYLVMKATPQRRDALCELLWDVPDDPRGSLRWSLSKLRPLVNSESAERLSADRERVTFRPLGASIDFVRAQIANGAELQGLSDTDLQDLWGSCGGTLLAGLELPAQFTFESWRLGQQERARQIQLRLIDEMIRRADKDPDTLTNLLFQRVELDPLHAPTHLRLIQHLAATGRRADAERQAALSRLAVADVGGLSERNIREALEAISPPLPPQINPPLETPASLRQEIRFCTAVDGVRIAYATVGSGPPFVKTANWLNHLEFDWESPIWRHMFRALAQDHTLIRYDSRGNGLSDWNVEDLSLDALVTDLKAVVDAAGVERFPLLGISQGCAVAVEFSIRYPERVSKLVLYGGYAQGWKHLQDEDFVRQTEAMITLTRIGWGKDNLAYRQMFTSLFIPQATPEQMGWFNELQRITTSPENAARLLEALGDFDVLPRLPDVRVPTLVMHARGDARVSYECGRELAAGIPGARFVTLESSNHLILEQEPAWPRFLSEMKTFLAGD